MERLDSYIVDLRGMTTDAVSYQWQADDDFFSAVQGPEIQHGQLDVTLRVKRTSGLYELEFQLRGKVSLTCDRCLEPMDHPIDTTRTLRAKLGSEFEDDGETVTVPEEDGTLDVAWYVYELAALEIPLRHVHPEGQCNLDMQQSLNQHTAGEEEEKPTDPRWDELRKILDKH